MTPDERQALREKHTYLGDYCGFCVKDGGYPADYPCDVIKVLDYLDVVDPMESTELPWAYRDWSYEVSKQEPTPEINWAGGK
jgi:hypothetical protein